MSKLVELQNFGFLGVDLFFVLSGFLITGILYDAVNDAQYFRSFYIRRSLRIFPLFYGLYLLIALLMPVVGLRFSGYVPAFLLYVGNLVPTFAGDTGPLNVVMVPVHAHWYTAASLSHFWTLCVEEQFYLIWPAVVLLIRDRAKLMRVCVGGAIVALVLRTVLWWAVPHRVQEVNLLYTATYTRFDSLLIGAYPALFLRGRLVARRQLHRVSASLFVLCATLALAGGMVGYRHWAFHRSPYVQTVGYTFIALASCGVLLRSLDDASRVSAFLRSRMLARLGIVSYGFYVIHNIPGTLLREVVTPIQNRIHAQYVLRSAIFIGWFLLTWCLAELSFRFFETPFLRLKKRLAPETKRIHVDLPA